jgi:glycosyltransferase involved in cell wall biosynthesis
MTIAFPHEPGHGGPGSFQTRFEKSLKAADWTVVYAQDRILPDVVMVVGGTKRLSWLWRMKRKRVPVIHRLDGLAWLHRRQNIKTFLYGEWGNLLFKTIHGFFADHVVYQSAFVKQWWEQSGWRRPKSSSVIYNGVDLSKFKPEYNEEKPIDLLCLEGTLDYSPYAIQLLNELQAELGRELSIVAYGGFQNAANQDKLHAGITYKGKLTRDELPAAYRNAIYLSLDVNAACPNTVAEALASGIPVVGYDTGALKELVGTEAGCIVPYGSDPWELQMPDTAALIAAIRQVKQNYEQYARAARASAVQRFGMPNVFEEYLCVIERVCSSNTQNHKI